MTESTRDRKGVELTDMDEVREEARRLLLLAAGYRTGKDRSGWTIDVRDEAGNVVLSLTLKDATAYVSAFSAANRREHTVSPASSVTHMRHSG